MDLYLQFGHGMMEHCRHFVRSWGGGTAILSPRDLTAAQLSQLSEDLLTLPNGNVLLDPQFYVPNADHERLCAHDYWPDEYETGAFWQGPALAQLIERLFALNADLGTNATILPGLLANRVDEMWLETQTAFIEGAAAGPGNPRIFVTIALGSDALRDQEQVGILMEAAETWNASGYYLVFEHPNGDYLVSDPNWLANALDIVAGLRLLRADVIVGYCNQQMLVAGLAGANAIASGTWMNVRSFPPDKFRANHDEEIRQRAIWYYCAACLSEYKIPFLDIAHRLDLLDAMSPTNDDGYADALFAGGQPTSATFREPDAFRHYLSALRQQALQIRKGSFEQTVDSYEDFLDRAEAIQNQLSGSRIRGQLRDFGEIFDVNRAAIAVLASTRGAILRRSWESLS